jgi:hypothetical protein
LVVVTTDTLLGVATPVIGAPFEPPLAPEPPAVAAPPEPEQPDSKLATAVTHTMARRLDGSLLDVILHSSTLGMGSVTRMQAHAVLGSRQVADLIGDTRQGRGIL